MLTKRIIITLIIALIACKVAAFYPYVRNYSKNTSKAGNQNWDIAQHDNQWVYFANNKGLLEFDGYQWAVYSLHNHTLVRSLFYDRETDRIYIGAYNQFGYYERADNGVLTYKKLSDSRKFNIFSDIWNIHKLKNNFVYQADFDVLLTKESSIIIYKFDDKINHSAIINDKLIISQLNKGIRYFDGGKFVECTDNGLLKKKVVRAILPYGEDKILFVTDVHGIYIYDGAKFSKFKTDIDTHLVNDEVFCAAIKNNILAIGTVQNGLIVKNLSDNSTVFLNNETGLQNNTVLSISFDNNNNLWLGLDKGIDYVVINSPITDLIGNPHTVGSGYSSLVYNNKLYLATNQGLYYMDYDKSKQVVTSGVKPIPQIKGQVWNLCQIGGDLFCSCDKGLYVFSGNSLEKINDLNGVWNVKPIKANPNILLGAEYNEFFIIKKVNGKWKKTNVVSGFNEATKSFIEDDEGKIWITNTINGIYRLSINEAYDTFTKIEIVKIVNSKQEFFPINNISISEINNQIIASTENGFYFFNKKSTSFIKSDWLNRMFGLPKHVSNVYIDPGANVWSVASNKIMITLKGHTSKYVIDSVSFSFLKDKLLTGFEHINFLSQNKALIATENGFSVYDNTMRNSRGEHSKLAFKSVCITIPKDSVLNGYLTHQIGESKPRISYSNNSLRFEFVCSEYSNENSVLYSSFLENYDEKWSNYSLSGRKEYSKIPPGNYIFKVKARNLTSLKVETLEYAFTILPPWYIGSIAKIIYISLLIIAIYLMYLFINYRTYLAARTMELKKEQEIKEQEKQFVLEAKEKEKEIIALKNKQLEHDLRHKSQDLASSTMNVIRKNEILLEMKNHLTAINEQLMENKEPQSISKKIHSLQKEISSNIETDNNWVKFQENFDLVYENYLARLGDTYPCLTQNDKKICAYLRMNLSSKDIAPLVNTTYQSVEMTRHRLRKKLNLDRSVNLSDFLHHF